MEGPFKLHSPPSNFRHFFFRGLAILLPSVLTIWILLAAYQFVQVRIADPINRGVREVIVLATPWPVVENPEDYRSDALADRETRQALQAAQTQGGKEQEKRWLADYAKRAELQRWWNRWSPMLDLIGLVIATVLIYMAGMLLGSYIGRRLYARGEYYVNQVPLVGRVYPAVKQVTDFFVGQDREKVTFNRVVAVQYPRRGLWSVGLVTGDTMRTIQEAAGTPCMTVFVPSSPTPFTGYVITVPKSETIELPISVEDAMKFAVSGGVLIPPSQVVDRPADEQAAADDEDTASSVAPSSLTEASVASAQVASPADGRRGTDS